MSTLTKSCLALLLALFSISGFADVESPELGVKANNSLWEKAVNGKESDLSQLYTDDAVILPPSLEIIETPVDINNYWFKQISPAIDDFQLESVSIRAKGNTAYQSAVWVATLVSNGERKQIDGEMTNVMVKQADGSWKIVMQSWN